MKRKILIVCLIITSLLGYMEWGGDNHLFLAQAELEVLSKLLQDPISAAHPLTLIPLLGQLLLFCLLFQKTPSKMLTLTGLGCLSILLLFLFFIGLISFNYKILISTIPFLVTGIMTIMEFSKR